MAKDNADRPECRICRDEAKKEGLISPCACSGSVLLVHPSCLRRWVDTRSAHGIDNLRCELCDTDYACAVQNKVEVRWFVELASVVG